MDLRAVFVEIYEWFTDRIEAWRGVLRWACLIVGSVSLPVAAGNTIQTALFLRNSLSTAGIITSNLPKLDKENNSTTYTPVFTFVGVDGQSHTVTGDVSSDPPEFRLGQHVEVRYDKIRPEGARIASFWQLWGFSTIFGVLGVAAGLTGLLLRRYERWLDRKGLSLRVSGSRV